MSKELSPLEALNDLRNSGLVKDDVVCFTKKALEIRLDIIETALKALEIIKNMYNWETMIPNYAYVFDKEHITKEDFDLLKEVLK